MIRPSSLAPAVALVFAALPSIGLAHTQTGVAGGLITGFLHPVLGLDHLVAMVAVGIWGSVLGAPLLIALPIAFPLMMAVGALIGIMGLPLPGTEYIIALSAVVLGVAVCLRLRPPVWAAIALVAVFAIFHGFAHGRELPPASNPLSYALGFVLATGLLHLCGIGIGELARQVPRARLVAQASGAAIAAVGLFFTVSGFTA